MSKKGNPKSGCWLWCVLLVAGSSAALAIIVATAQVVG